MLYFFHYRIIKTGEEVTQIFTRSEAEKFWTANRERIEWIKQHQR
jgi:hypothetical protein